MTLQALYEQALGSRGDLATAERLYRPMLEALTLGRDDSVWYPSMTLFRQQTDGGWAGVFARMQSQVPR